MIAGKITPGMTDIAPHIEEAIAHGKKVKLTVTGNSMYPLFKDRRDRAVLSPIEKLKKRDVVFYKRQNGQYVLHRIVKKKGNMLTIAGDNETVKEYQVNVSDCIAVMESFERNSKESNVSDLWYKVYSFFWVAFFPFRKQCRKFLHFGSKLFGANRKKD
ncbi:MAG: S24/S26 family peptidase [Clostridia bacterium]|nr:S24/S26 family peptidase [Clostridia bacterium]